MTITAERTRGKSGAVSAIPRTLPQVNLLPPEVRAARNLRATKRWLGIALVVVVALLIGVWGLAKVSAASAAGDLADAQDNAAQLQAKEAKYAEVPKVLGALSSLESAKTFGMSTEVQWKPYVDALVAVLPAGVSIDNYTATVAGPAAVPPTATDPLQTVGVGQIVLAGRTLTVPDTAAWSSSLDSVPGFYGATVTSVAISAGTDNSTAYYAVAVTVQINSDAYSHRFDPKGQS
jgi:hypothetical protein